MTMLMGQSYFDIGVFQHFQLSAWIPSKAIGRDTEIHVDILQYLQKQAEKIFAVSRCIIFFAPCAKLRVYSEQENSRASHEANVDTESNI